MAAKKAARPRTRLYLITPPQLHVTEFVPPLDEALAAGDVACLQLRLKNTDNHAADEALIAEVIAHHAGRAPP